MKANAIVCIGNSGEQQILIMCADNKSINGTHPKQHSFFLAEVEDDKDYLTVRVHKNTLKTAEEHYSECRKHGAERNVDLNLLRWDSLIMQKIWSFIRIK